METKKIDNPYEGIEYYVFPNLYTAKVPSGRRRHRCVGIFATLEEAVEARRAAAVNNRNLKYEKATL